MSVARGLIQGGRWYRNVVEAQILEIKGILGLVRVLVDLLLSFGILLKGIVSSIVEYSIISPFIAYIFGGGVLIEDQPSLGRHRKVCVYEMRQGFTVFKLFERVKGYTMRIRALSSQGISPLVPEEILLRASVG